MSVWEAARNAGVDGFVWKSHEQHTVDLCRELPSGPPYALGSASLNAWSTLEGVVAAIESGAKWIWGPTRAPGNLLAWDLLLPSWWSDLAAYLRGLGRPIVLATGHLGPAGRRAFAATAMDASHLRCSITHSLYLPTDEVEMLRNAGCAFEVDLYTAAYRVGGRPHVDLISGLERLWRADAWTYLTSDAGQEHVGDPYLFAAGRLEGLEQSIGRERTRSLAVANPERVAAFARGCGEVE
jgi:hypothetical protein